MRFPSIMDDRKQFNRDDYVENPLFNNIVQRRNRLLNGESAQRLSTEKAFNLKLQNASFDSEDDLLDTLIRKRDKYNNSFSMNP